VGKDEIGHVDLDRVPGGDITSASVATSACPGRLVSVSFGQLELCILRGVLLSMHGLG